MIVVTVLMATIVPPQYAKRNKRTAPKLGKASAGAREGVPSHENP